MRKRHIKKAEKKVNTFSNSFGKTTRREWVELAKRGNHFAIIVMDTIRVKRFRLIPNKDVEVRPMGEPMFKRGIWVELTEKYNSGAVA